MSTMEVWVHGTSGQIEPAHDDWGWAMPVGWGLHLDGRVEEWDARDETWVHFHIPLPCLRPEAPDAPRLQKVMLKFATDCDKPGWFAKYPSLHASQMWRKSVGGAIIHKLHIWDSDAIVQKFEGLGWQSDNIDTCVVESKTLEPERAIHWGLGISVNVRFINQSIIDWKIQPESGEGYPPGWWDGKPFIYKDAATESKRIFFASVGCRYAAKP